MHLVTFDKPEYTKANVKSLTVMYTSFCTCCFRLREFIAVFPLLEFAIEKGPNLGAFLHFYE